MKAKRNIAKRRVFIPTQHWTAFSTAVFDEIFPVLGLHRSALVYLVLYHRVWHKRKKRVRASFKKLSDWTGLDYRTVEKCLHGMEARGFVNRTVKGVRHSRTHTPVWRVPAAEFDMSTRGWVPIPSFIIDKYLPAHPSCVVLPLILYYQNMWGQNYCWASVSTLSRMLHWSKRMTYEALKLMEHREDWEKLETSLPRPLAIYWRKNHKVKKWVRRYQVRAVHYHRERTRELPKLFLTREFSKRFKIKAKLPPEPIWFEGEIIYGK